MWSSIAVYLLQFYCTYHNLSFICDFGLFLISQAYCRLFEDEDLILFIFFFLFIFFSCSFWCLPYCLLGILTHNICWLLVEFVFLSSLFPLSKVLCQPVEDTVHLWFLLVLVLSNIIIPCGVPYNLYGPCCLLTLNSTLKWLLCSVPSHFIRDLL